MASARADTTTPSGLAIEADSDVRVALEGMGRTEDLAFSPGLRRFAMTGFLWNLIYVFELDRNERLSSGRIVLTDYLEISSESLKNPHGVAFLDEDTIVVANRSGIVTVFRLPPVGYGAHELALNPRRTLRGSWRRRISTPGSVAVRELGSEQVEILVCNNYKDTVTKHRLDCSRDYQVRSNDVLLNAGLAVPDGITVSHDGHWVAVSNHNNGRILIYEYDPALTPQSMPVGELLDVDCPHGLHFTDDDRCLVVASAASPFLHVYAIGKTGNVDWRGEHEAVAILG